MSDLVARLSGLGGGAMVPSSTVRIDIGKSILNAAVFQLGDEVVIPIVIRHTATGKATKIMIETDGETFARAVAKARELGLTAVRLQDLAEHMLGARPILSLEHRVLPHELG